MYKTIFNNKNLTEITIEDINKLKTDEIAESWFIEYKSERILKKRNDKEKDKKRKIKIAKSIASFANSNGGYYIIGIKESDDSTNTPGEIEGIDINTYKNPLETITQIIKSYISPIPLYHTKLINLSKNKKILIVEIPEGFNPPYIVNDSIYQRIGETTEPITIKK